MSDEAPDQPQCHASPIPVKWRYLWPAPTVLALYIGLFVLIQYGDQAAFMSYWKLISAGILISLLVSMILAYDLGVKNRNSQPRWVFYLNALPLAVLLGFALLGLILRALF